MNYNDFDNSSSSVRHDIMSQRAFSRNQPSQQLQPYLSARPVLTKYSIMPIVDPRKEIHTPLIQRATYNPKQIFNPGNDFGPWSGYASNINDESELRNQVYALQRSSQAVYVPSSESSLYTMTWKNNNVPHQPFPNLFVEEKFGPDNKNVHSDTVGFALFNNATRQQIKNVKTN
jgi:hypothetical protein